MARKETPTRKIDKLVEERMKESGRIGVAESKKAGKKRKRFKFVRGKSGRLRAQLGKKRSDAPMPSGNTYRIRRGDTLSGIAKRLGTTVSKLMALNPYNPKTGKGIKDANKIRAGAMLNIRGTKPSVRQKAAKNVAEAMKENEEAGEKTENPADKTPKTSKTPKKQAGKTPKVETKRRGLSFPAGRGTVPQTAEERKRDVENRARISKEKGRGGASRSMLDRFKDMMRGRGSMLR